MDYLYDFVSSFSGRTKTPAEEREEAVQNVRFFTGKSNRRESRAALEVPGDDLSQEAIGDPIVEAFTKGEDGEQSPIPGPFDISSRRSLDSLSTNLFCPEGQKIPGREPKTLGPAAFGSTPTVADPSLDPDTSVFTDGATPTPNGMGGGGLSKKTNVATEAPGKGYPPAVDEPSSLPLDGDLLAAMGIPTKKTELHELAEARRELASINQTRKLFLREVDEKKKFLLELQNEMASHKVEVDKLLHQRVSGECEVASLTSLGKDLSTQLHLARQDLASLRQVNQDLKTKSEKVPPPSTVVPPVIPIPSVYTTVTPSSVPPLVHTTVTGMTPQMGASYLQTPVCGGAFGGTATPPGYTHPSTGSTMLNQQQTMVSVPVPKPRARQGLTPVQRAKYDRNPAIEKLGTDIVPRDIDELDERYAPFNFGEIKHPDAARQKAIDIPPFTGSPPWRKYKVRFKAIVESNRWNNQQALVALKQALCNGPGEPALLAFERVKIKTLSSLEETAEWAIGKIGEHDPRTQLLKRVQRKDEHLRSYGFALQELISECYQGCRPDTPTVIQELTSRFVNGVRDTNLQAYLREKWQPDLSLADLFDHADVYDTKQAVFPSGGVSAAPSVAPKGAQVVEAATKPPKKKQPASEEVAAVMPDRDMEKMIEGLLRKHLEKSSASTSDSGSGKRRKKKKKDTKPQPCRRCQKMGHWASECKAPAPVAAKTEKETEN